MKNKISKVYPDSIAEEMGIEVGDKLLSINNTPVKDIIDYKFLLSDEEIDVEIEKTDGEIWEMEIEKDYDEDLGIEFENAIIDNAKCCSNKCIFCFIDQLPKGMRETMYFKDDDSRLSFFQGNFVTLTNMKDEDIDRIIKYRISPINVSVHTTNPELRVKMLNNRFAGNVYERLTKLSKADINMNCQIVLCPNINDNNELVRTVEDLYKLYPAVRNVAVVPVGITKYRDGLYNLNLYDKEGAAKQLDLVSKLQNKYIKETGEPFVRLSDEFYITARREVPESSFYSDYEQLEDGVGMIRLFRENIKNSLMELNNKAKGSFTILTGSSAFNEISEAAYEIESQNKNIKINAVKIINRFFGETITVAGLITGNDIINELQLESTGEYVLIPKNMLRNGEDVFLDDITLKDLENKINRKILVCEYSGEDLIETINSNCKEV